jgi:DNA polymerase III delta subunit
MLYIFTGSDTLKAKEKALKLAKGHELVRFGEGGEPVMSALAYIGARGMFSPKVALLIDRPFETEEGKEFFKEHLGALQESDTLVFIIEPVLDAAAKKAIPKKAEVESFDLEEKSDEPLPSVFALTDAFAAGDRKKSWVLYRRFIEEGVVPEEIHGALAWQARALVLAAKTKSATQSGLKPFVYMKSKRIADSLGEEKTEAISRELVSLYHRSRAGEGDLEDLLEVFLLKKA